MKRIIYFSLVAFLIILGSSKVENVSAQGKSEPKKVTTAHFGSFDLVFELWCGNKVIDVLSGTMNWHCTMQYQNGVMTFMNMKYYGSFTGNSGEVFKYEEIFKQDASAEKFYKVHFNAIGDKGNHIIVSYYFYENWVFVLDKAICN